LSLLSKSLRYFVINIASATSSVVSILYISFTNCIAAFLSSSRFLLLIAK